MSELHTATIPILISCGGDETEILIEVEFTITRGSPARGPSYSSGGEPAEPAEIDYRSFYSRVPVLGQDGHFNHEPAPQWLAAFLTNSDDVYQACGDAAEWGEHGPDPDEAYERARDDKMMEFEPR